jgi:cyclopropane-fatty-acyl-phospholipid synthase
MLLGGETGAGEAYMDGLWSSPDLAALIRVAALNREALALSAGWWRSRSSSPGRRPSPSAQHEGPGRRNIAAHYDLGNDFYRLFLDETMTYSSAVFESPDQSLADAQRTKYRRIAEGAGLSGSAGQARPGDRLGLGRLRPVRRRRARLPGDLDHDLEGAARPGPRAGPGGRPGAPRRHPAARLPRDRGTYDAIVSIEMLEAVGAEYFETFFEACDRALRRAAG